MAQKDASVAELTKSFENSNAVLLTEYRGLTVAQLKELRNSIRQDAEYAVVKNTLTKIAANKAGISTLDEDLKGPSAIAFVHGDPVSVAKGLRAFAKAHPLLVIKGGYFDGNPVENRAEIVMGLPVWGTLPYFTQPALCKSFAYWANDVEIDS